MGDRKSITEVAAANLCISCGLCKAVCPAHCIEYRRDKGMYEPSVSSDCRHCGICRDICPGRGCDYRELYSQYGKYMPENPYAGYCIEAFTAVSRDQAVLKNATSGGLVTTLVRHLLCKGDYDCAFLVDGHCYADAVHSSRKTGADNLLSTSKSRYVPVMQTEAIEYMLHHRDERIVFVGVPCFVQGLLRIMAHYGIRRERHLLIGLFCASTMNYNVWGYLTGAVQGDATALHFRDKASGGNGKLCSRWPGDICVFDKDGRPVLMPKAARTDAKEYFTPERCLYCLDKLNQFADLSVGDNYTRRNAPKSGSSSVLVRTTRGLVAKNEALFNIHPADMDEICESQKLSGKVGNLCFQRFCQSPELIRNDEFYLPENWESWRTGYEDARREQALGEAADFEGIKAAIREKALEKKKRKSILYKFLRFWQR